MGRELHHRKRKQKRSDQAGNGEESFLPLETGDARAREGRTNVTGCDEQERGSTGNTCLPAAKAVISALDLMLLA